MREIRMMRSTDLQRADITGHANRVTSATFSPDGARIVTASFDTTARLWDAVTGDCRACGRSRTSVNWLEIG